MLSVGYPSTMAKSAKKVIGVESNKDAVRDAMENAARNGAPKVQEADIADEEDEILVEDVTEVTVTADPSANKSEDKPHHRPKKHYKKFKKKPTQAE